MKVLILGATGMLGHKLVQTLSSHADTFATVRPLTLPQKTEGLFEKVHLLRGVNAENFEHLKTSIDTVQPEVVVNCIGIVKQLAQAQDAIDSISINALLPHLLAKHCMEKSTRLITISTDCVFSGKTGNYSQDDQTDPVDLYGRTKLLGEVCQPNCLTIRTSMIGRQLIGTHGLVEWLLGQNGKRIKGYKRAIFSGFTTNALSRLLIEIIYEHQNLDGLWQVAAQPISKYDLLHLVRDSYALDVEIDQDETFLCDRSLNGQPFSNATGIVSPDWPDMIDRMKNDPTEYPTTSLLKC
jgi:dTDP-4-dehydrorhamnose reductase